MNLTHALCTFVLVWMSAPFNRLPGDDIRDNSPVITTALSARIADAPDASVRVWVFFTDKRIDSAAELNRRIAARAAELPERTLRRRALRGMNPQLVTIADLAVLPEYIAEVLAAGAELRHEIRSLNAISIDVQASRLSEIAELPFVRRIQPVARGVRRSPIDATTESLAISQPRGFGPAWYAASFDQLNQIGIVDAHNAGFTGADVIIGVLDTGFNRTHDAFNQTTNGAHPVQVLAEHDFIKNDNDTTQQPGDTEFQSSHGTLVLGVIAAYHPTVCVGGAFDASFMLAKTEDISQEVPAEEDDYAAAIEWLETLGADMSTSSLSYDDWYTQTDFDGATAVTTLAVNAAIANGLICCTAAGNTGNDLDPLTSRLSAPGDAPLMMTCGAVDETSAIAYFSSDGPTADGRVKPEVLARGVSTQTTDPSSDSNIVGVPGTSFSTPLVAAGVALVIEAHPDWNVIRIRRALFQTADGFLANSTFDPAYVRGYGIINVHAAIQFVHGDINGDGLADGRDIQPFMSALLGTNPDAAQRRRADMNTSGDVSMDDVGEFVGELLGA